MADTQEKRLDDSNKPEAGKPESSNPLFDELTKEQKSESLPQKSQDSSKSSNIISYLPAFEITNDKACTGKSTDNTRSGDAGSESGKTQDKLASSKFGPDKVIEAFSAAKELNVPVIVNRNMDGCLPSQRSNIGLDKYIKSHSESDKAPAVVVDLNMDKLNSMRKEQAGMPDGPQKDSLGEELKLAYKLMNDGHGVFPELSKYDANDSSKPRANVLGADPQTIERLLNQKEKPSTNSDSKTESSLELQYKPHERKVLKFSEKDMASAVEIAKENNLPLIVLTGSKFCEYSKQASYKIDELAQSMAVNADPKAVIVKLDVSQMLPTKQSPSAETDNQMPPSEKASREMATKLMSQIHMVPHIAVYNPNKIPSFVGPSMANLNADMGTLHTQLTVAGKKAMDKSK